MTRRDGRRARGLGGGRSAAEHVAAAERGAGGRGRVDGRRRAAGHAAQDLAPGGRGSASPPLGRLSRAENVAAEGGVRATFRNMKVQIFVACLIPANFIVSATARFGVDPTPTRARGLRRAVLEHVRAPWFWLFWGDGWNVFDFITVAVGWITEVGIELPGPLGMLRMVRALRVFRLFKRVKSLRKILESLARAVPGVANAFLIMLITMCIYAILAVDFFQAEGRDGVFHFESGATKLDAQRGLLERREASAGRRVPPAVSGAGATRFWVDNFDGTGLIGDVTPARGEWLAHHEKQVDGAGTYYTPRGNEWGHEYFGTFGKSLFTLFQVLTGDSWAEAIGRPLLEGWFPMSTALFFVSFILLHSVVLINLAELKAARALEGGQAAVIAEVKVLGDLARR
ncbi:low voltage-gated calcium channel [Aureococcus anophagefferens]|nr:low voltage-gated calcium channel [Aureococcus anophagefferens]